MRVLVTGATGLLGNNITRALLAEGHDVKALVRSLADARPFAGLRVERHQGQLEDLETLRECMSDVDAVIHSAGYVKIGWSDYELARRVNVGGAMALAEIARDRGIRMVHVSTINTLGLAPDQGVADETTPVHDAVPCTYIRTKTEAEQKIHAEIERGLDAVIVHPSFMLGPWDWKPSSGSMLLEVIGRRPPLAPSGGISVASAEDVAAGALGALSKGRCGEHYILAGHNMSYLELWRKFANLKGRPGAWGAMGPAMRWVVGTSGDLWAKVTGKESDINSAMLRMGAQVFENSNIRVEQALATERSRRRMKKFKERAAKRKK